MATRTTNLSLVKPDYADNADIAVINANMDTLDTAITGEDGYLANHYLPLAGGIMTGTFPIIKKNDSTGGIQISGADTVDNGASLNLIGINYANEEQQGSFELYTGSKNSMQSTLVGKADGELIWKHTGSAHEIKDMAFPSATSVDISTYKGSAYTAPANGYIMAKGIKTTASGAYIHLNATCGVFDVDNSTNANDMQTVCPIKKGQTIGLYYSIPESTFFSQLNYYFIYAEGEI